jgi:hypothetical protein
MICQETDAALASIVVDYLDEVRDLISELSEATVNDQCAGDQPCASPIGWGVFRMMSGIVYQETESNVYH